MPIRSSLRAVDRVVLILLTALAILLLAAVPVRAGQKPRTVGMRETLYDIAWEYDTTPETLRWLNNMSATEPAWTGMRMRVPPADGLVLYRVEAGDTLATVAGKYGVALPDLVEYNDMSPAQQLVPGHGLLVPHELGFKLTREVPTHVVQEGETLETIAAAYDASTRAINRVNELNGRAPKVGASLVIPTRLLSERLGEIENDAPAGSLAIPLEAFPSLTEKWVSVDLSEQRVVAFEGTRPVADFLISSGRSPTPTVTGVFRIRAKVAAQTMEGGSRETGDYYNLPNVQWVSYFYQAYSFHGTYWHRNFGHPMSHGCINMTNADAEWLYNWMGPQNPGRGWFSTPDTEKGTLVVVHY